jgi:diaminopimelate epimerase
MPNLDFHKMQAYLNDFIIFLADQEQMELTPEAIIYLCDRRRCIGADQLIIVTYNKTVPNNFYCRIFNSDGSEAFQCGNGLRCVAKLLSEKFDTKIINLQTKSGTYVFKISNDLIECDMGKAIFSPKQIPLRIPTEQNLYSTHINQHEIKFVAVNIGNPHAVIFDSPKELCSKEIFLHLNNKELFPEGANVSFVERIDANNIKLQVYERGAGPTPSCGSGACAAAVAGIKLKYLNNEVNVKQSGGVITVIWHDNNDASVVAYGSASYCYRGIVTI